MRTVGVRELKAHLSRVLRAVQGGESYLVTDRGRVVAELRRPDGAAVEVSSLDRAIARLAADGLIRVNERAGTPSLRTPVRVPDGTALALLQADRDER